MAWCSWLLNLDTFSKDAEAQPCDWVGDGKVWGNIDRGCRAQARCHLEVLSGLVAKTTANRVPT